MVVSGTTLPHIEIRWPETDAADPFMRYNIYRREAGTLVWTRIAFIDLQAQLYFRDYAVKSRVSYEYSVTVTTDVSSAEVESDKSAPLIGRVAFDWTYIHDVSSPPDAWCAFYSREGEQESAQDVRFNKAWGRNAETGFIGELEASRLTLRGYPDVHQGEIWPAMRNLQTQQRTNAAIYCVRQGASSDLFFANMAQLTKNMESRTYTPRVDLVETFFDEAV